MVNSIGSNGSDIIESIDVVEDQQKHQESPKTKHLFSTEIFERDDLWNDFNIVQQVDASNSNKTSSGVWKYFGKLHFDNQIIDEGYFYCISCYSNRVTKKYQTNTSTGNLIKHMVRAHDVLLEHPVYRIKRDSDSYTVIKEESNSINSTGHDIIYDINQLLIDEVHKRPQLYDSTLCRKNKHQIRQDLWFQVYETLNHLIPLERLPKIWKNIRDRYQKVRRSCEKDENKIPKYRYYERLRFLDSVIDTSMNKGSQSALMKLEEDQGDEQKEKCVYYVEEKSPDELFEVLELRVDDMESEEAGNDNSDPYPENIEDDITIKCETITRRRSSSLENCCETDDLSNYEFQNNSEMGESEFFSIDNEVDDEQQPKTKRVKISHDQHGSATAVANADLADKSSTVCEFEIFGNYVAAVMKNMKKNDARQLQMKIVELINSYDEDES